MKSEIMAASTVRKSVHSSKRVSQRSIRTKPLVMTPSFLRKNTKEEAAGASSLPCRASGVHLR